MSDPFRRFDDYDFRHFVAIRAAGGGVDDVHRLLALQDDEGRNAWFAARDGRGELSGYVDDAHLATGLTHAAAVARRVARRAEAAGLQARYALIAAILRDAARNFEPALSAALVRAGLWTREHALAWADLHPDRETALATVVDALEAPGAPQEDLAMRALATGAAIGSSDNMTIAVAELAPRLPAHQRGRALEVIAREENEGSRLGGLLRIAEHLPPALWTRAVSIAQGFRQIELRAEALAIVAARLDEPRRGETYAQALAAAQDALASPRRGSFQSAGARALERLAEILPQDLLSNVLDLASAVTMSTDQTESIIAAVLARRAYDHPDSVLMAARKLDQGFYRDRVLKQVAIAFARAGRAADALDAFGEISSDPAGAEAATSLALDLPPDRLVELTARTLRLNSYHRVEALSAIARAPGAPGTELQTVVERLPDGEDRRSALLAVLPALAPETVDDVLGPDPGLDRMEQAAPHLTRGQTLRVLNATRGRRVSGLDRHAFGALLRRLAQLGDPDEALARVAELEDMWELDRGKMLAALAPELPTELLLRARALVQPDAIPVPRLRALAELLGHLPEERHREILAAAERLADPLDRVRAYTAIFDGSPPEWRAEAAAGLLRAIQTSLDHPSLDRRAVHAQGWRRLGEAALEAALGTAQTLDDLDDRFTALLSLTPAFADAATHAIQLVATYPRAGAIISAEHSSPEMRRGLSDAIGAIADDVTMARAVAALGEIVVRAEVPSLVARLAAIADPDVRLPGLYALASRMPAALRRQVARKEFARRSQWRRSTWLQTLGVGVVACCDRAVAEPLIGEVSASIRTLTECKDRVNAALFLAEALDDVIDADLLEDVLGQEAADIDMLRALIPRLDRDGILRTQEALPDLVPGFRQHEFIGELARRAFALGDDQLALACLTERDDVYRIQDAVIAVANQLPRHLIAPVSEIAALDSNALSALARRAARLGDGDKVLDLVDRASDRGRADILAEIAPLAPAAIVPALVERARSMGYDAARAIVALIPRVPRPERRDLLSAAVAAAFGFRFAMAETRVQLIQELTPELARLPVAELTETWGDALRQSADHGREEVLCDIRGFAPALVRRLGPEVATALDEAIRTAAGDHWP